jgi:7-carboxy-7-deazaguanine synthase
MIPIIPQNADRNVSARDYKALDGRLLVSSVFATHQGEGPLVGRPAMFVRLAGCNYGSKTDFCHFCDTSFQFDTANAYTPQELLDFIMTQGYNKKQILVITGGEPTLQLALLDLIVLAEPMFETIQLETNGTQPKFYLEAVRRKMTKRFVSVVSPKANVNTGKYPKINNDVLWWANCLKFVISADPDNPHHEVPDWALESHKPIYVSPMVIYQKAYMGEVSSIWEDGLVDKVQTAANFQYAAAYALKHSINVSIQAHIFLGIA